MGHLFARLMLALVLLSSVLPAMTPALAQLGTDRNTTPQVTEITAPEPSFLTQTILCIQAEQQRLHRALAGAIRTLKAEGSVTAAWALISLSFLYGVFHAAGPGHGKAVLSTYLVTQPTALKKSLALAAASSFMQGVTAIVVVLGVLTVLGVALRSSGMIVQWLEAASFALVACVGAWLIWRSLRVLFPQLAPAGGGHHHHHHDHGHGHAHDHDHDHAHHDHDCGTHGCGHTHMPTPQQASAAGSLREMAGVVFSIGVRPCSGAILVLVFAQVAGMTLAGIAAVLAMSAGTALAVALIALAAVGLRDGAWAVTRLDDARVEKAVHWLAIAGGVVLVLMGSLFAYASATQVTASNILM
ncbi:nickel/cobalt transporter [Pyruvatibacter mobilis]|uniref:nickel/cobalt transporter n=1 Tax=Pyruvatibacter mobilis TaxID=1712261 RepID=UPI003BAB1363